MHQQGLSPIIGPDGAATLHLGLPQLIHRLATHLIWVRSKMPLAPLSVRCKNPRRATARIYRRPTVLWLAFLLCVAFSAITIPFLSEERLLAAVLGFGGIFVLGICISAVIDAAGYCGTMFFRAISIYMPGWITAFMLARTIVVTGRSVNGVRPSAGRVVLRGVLWLAAIAAFGLITLLSIAADPMVESRICDYNGQHYGGPLSGVSTVPVLDEELGPIR